MAKKMRKGFRGEVGGSFNPFESKEEVNKYGEKVWKVGGKRKRMRA